MPVKPMVPMETRPHGDSEERRAPSLFGEGEDGQQEAGDQFRPAAPASGIALAVGLSLRWDLRAKAS